MEMLKKPVLIVTGLRFQSTSPELFPSHHGIAINNISPEISNRKIIHKAMFI